MSWIRIPKAFNAKLPKSRRDLASAMRNAVREGRPPARGTNRSEDFGRARYMPDQEKKIADLRRALRAHPCHGCSEREDHARWAERWWKLRHETDGLIRQIQGRTNTIAKTFDRVCDVLAVYGYLQTSDAAMSPSARTASACAASTAKKTY
ncbi:probable helicase HelY [Arthrobacter sp. Hiyo8]|nr:probable helicase HelY [Arthrobacter sp. Hiyo8]